MPPSASAAVWLGHGREDESRRPEAGTRERPEEHEADDSLADDALIRPPVFVVDGEDVSVYDSLANAMATLEGVDVEDGLCSVYDADGRRITLKGVGVKRSRFSVEVGVVQATSIEAEPSGAEELRKSLLQFGRHSGWAVNEEMTLPELATLANRAP